MRSRPRSGSNPTFDVLRGGFGFYALGNFLSFVGTWMQMVSMAWLSWEITGSNAKVGFIAMCGGVASVALTPAAGVFADRHHPLLQVRVVQAAAFVHASALYLLVASGLANFVTLAMMSFIGGCVLAFDQPQRFSLIGALVDPERATTAFAINSTTFNAARFLGPTLAGVMIAAGQTTLSFLLNAVSYALFLLCLTLVRAGSVRRPPSPPRVPMREAVLGGLRFAAGHAGISAFLWLDLVLALTLRPILQLLPAYVTVALASGPEGVAWIQAAAGVGAMVMGLALMFRGRNLALPPLFLAAGAWSIAGLTALAAVDGVPAAAVAVFVAGAAMTAADVARQSLLQTASETYRGRLMALQSLVFRVGLSGGALLMGIVADSLGPRAPVLIGGAVSALAWSVCRARRGRIESSFVNKSERVDENETAPIRD